MKKNITKLLLAVLMLIATVSVSRAQVSISFNLGLQPTWGPAGYDRADYYYLPDIETYYNVSTHRFIYLNGDRWIFSANLPDRYRDYDLNSGYKVVVNRPHAYMNFYSDRAQYAQYRGFRGRQEIRRDHPTNNGFHNGWRNDQRPDNRGDQGHRDNGNRGDQGHRDNGNRGDQGHRDNGNRGDQGHRDNGNHGDQGRQGHDNGGDRGHGRDN